MNDTSRAWLAAFVLVLASIGCREGDESGHGAPAAVRPVPGSASVSSPQSTVPTPPAIPAPKPLVQTVLPRTAPVSPLHPAPVAAPTTSPAGSPSAGTTEPGTPRDDQPPAAPPPAPARDLRLEVHAIDAAQGEDGHGNVVPATHPVALDVIADAWGGRGLDPVLEVGDRIFRHYRHPGPGVLRYVAADGGALPAGAPVRLRWGEDSANSVPVAAALAVPQ